MSQNDFNLANQGFPSMRSDINSALQALASNSSGATAPSTTYANQFWYETDTNILHIRNESDTAWLDLMVIDGTTGSPSFNSGNVGIGTTSLTGLLTLGTTVPRLDFLESGGSAGFDNTVLARDADVFVIQTRNGGTFVSNDYRVTTNASGALTHEWRIGNTERMRIDSAGNVGIGTSSPSTLLDVAGTANATNITRGGSQVFSRNNILATVSQTSGVPTGGIIERGSNADGEYVRYADGTQICVNYNVGSQTTPTTLGAIYRATNATTWTYPAAFSASPVVSGNADDNLARWVSFDPPSTTSVAYRQLNANLATINTSVRTRVMAIGRWFNP